MKMIFTMILFLWMSACSKNRDFSVVDSQISSSENFESDESAESNEDEISEEELATKLGFLDRNLKSNRNMSSKFKFPLPDEPASDFEMPESFRSLWSSITWPMNKGRISSLFGPRGRKFHKGIDIAAPRGTSIFSAAHGQVIFTGFVRGYGRTVIVEHEDGFRTLYAHCSKYQTKMNRIVKAGDVIAKVGATGRAFGSHLHFEIRDPSNKAIDPMKPLQKEQTRISMKPTLKSRRAYL